jgi:hypothetical protein
MSEYPNSVLNELFISKLSSKEGIDKVAMEGETFIRTRLREVSFARKIINPTFVTKADLQRSVNHDGLVKIVDIEPESEAMAISFRGAPDTRYIEGERFEIPFFEISSEDFQKAEQELLAYEMPITEVIERNSVKDIQKIEDAAFISAVDNAIAATGKTDSVTVTGGYIDKPVFTKLFNILEAGGSDKLKTDIILMNNQDYNDLVLWDATSVGDDIGNELTINGYTYATIFGKKLIVTNKEEYVPQGTIYGFTSQEYLGKFYILEDSKFWIDKKKNIISFGAYETVGMGLGNIRGAAKVTFSA